MFVDMPTQADPLGVEIPRKAVDPQGIGLAPVGFRSGGCASDRDNRYTRSWKSLWLSSRMKLQPSCQASPVWTE